jgi:hypothetical protein
MPSETWINKSEAGEDWARNDNRPLTLAGGQSRKCYRERVAIFPKVLASDVQAIPNIGAAAIRQTRLGKWKEAGMP